MRKELTVFALVFVLLLSTISGNALAACVLSPQNLTVDGKVINCEKYNIDGSNYFKLRDLAYLLNGTQSQFSVSWDAERNTVGIITGQAYLPNGSELNLSGGDKSASTIPSSQTISVNGVLRSDLSVYNIGGNNFFKLRDLGMALGFSVDYDAGSNTAIVYSSSRGTSGGMTAENIYSLCSPAVAYIEVYDQYENCTGSGSGFFISADGKFVTCYHVIKDAAFALIQTKSGEIYEVDGLLACDADNDWAVLAISGAQFPYLTVGTSGEYTGGSEVYAIGSPLGLSDSISAGIVSNVSRPYSSTNYIQTTASISPGSSGGALINKNGRVIGITSASFIEGQSLNLAVPMSYVKLTGSEQVTPLWAFFQYDYSTDADIYDYLCAVVQENSNTYLDEDPAYMFEYGSETLYITYNSESDCVIVADEYVSDSGKAYLGMLFIDKDLSFYFYNLYVYSSIYASNPQSGGYGFIDPSTFDPEIPMPFEEYEGYSRYNDSLMASALLDSSLALLDYVLDSVFCDGYSVYDLGF